MDKYKGTVPLLALGFIFISIIIVVIVMAAINNKQTAVVDLPKEIKVVKSETKAHPALQQLIIDHYKIPKEYHKSTRYYYNYVDLNDDGVNEIFVIVVGPYTSGTSKNKALWVFEKEERLDIRQDFTSVTPPIIISDTVTKGVRELVFPYYDEGTKPKYSVVFCNNGHFPLLSNGKMVDTLDGITGDAILADSIVAETSAATTGLNLESK